MERTLRQAVQARLPARAQDMTACTTNLGPSQRSTTLQLRWCTLATLLWCALVHGWCTLWCTLPCGSPIARVPLPIS
jgi:hypothetical protein